MRANGKQHILKIRKRKGLKYILDEAYKILGNPIFVFNMEYELIAHSEGYDNDDRICAEFVKYGKLGAETIEFFKDENFIDAVANCNGTTYLSSEKLKYDRIFGQLYNDNSKLCPVADLVIVACEQPFCKDMSDLIATLCTVISSAFAKDKFYKKYAVSYQENIAALLLDGKIENKGIYSGHLANIYNSLKNNIFLVAANIESGAAMQKLMQRRDAFSLACPDFKYYIYSGYIVMLLSFEEKTLNFQNKCLRKIFRLAKKFNMPLGISDCFENLFEMNEKYRQALLALEEAKKTNETVVCYENLPPVQ